MAADVFARALAFAAGSADDVAALQKDVATLNTNLETTKNELNTNLETAKTELNTNLEETKTEINTELENTTQEINTELDSLSADLEIKRVKIFDSNIVKYNEMTDEEKMYFDIAIAAPAVSLTDEQQASINTIVGTDTETIMDLSETELNNQLDNIIGGE